MAIERRQSPWWLPIFAVVLASLSFVFGPCFGAAVAIGGNYLSGQTRSALSDAQQKQQAEDMKAINGKLDEVLRQNSERKANDATAASDLSHLKADLATETNERKREMDKLSGIVEENGKIVTAYVSKGKK